MRVSFKRLLKSHIEYRAPTRKPNSCVFRPYFTSTPVFKSSIHGVCLQIYLDKICLFKIHQQILHQYSTMTSSNCTHGNNWIVRRHPLN